MKPAPKPPNAPANLEWQPVVHASDCLQCAGCGELVCPQCTEHYADCSCPGPHQDDEFEYRQVDGRLQARRLSDEQ